MRPSTTAIPNGFVVVEGYKYPNHHHSKIQVSSTSHLIPNEYERLDKHILSKSFTPNIDFDNMKSLGNLSAKAIRKVMPVSYTHLPKRNITKMSQEYFKQLTGWKKQTNEHSRDAAMLVFGF